VSSKSAAARKYARIWRQLFGLRWQPAGAKRSEDRSAAATALSQGGLAGDLFPKRRRAPLAAAVQICSFLDFIRQFATLVS
jgi:hypothetical protein